MDGLWRRRTDRFRVVLLRSGGLEREGMALKALSESFRSCEGRCWWFEGLWVFGLVAGIIGAAEFASFSLVVLSCFIAYAQVTRS